MITILISLVWFGSGIYAGCAFYAYFQNKWPSLAERDKWRDREWLLFGIFGGLALFCCAMTNEDIRTLKYGLKIW